MQNNKPITLRRNFSWTFAGNLVYSGCQWGMLVVLAKLGSPEMVGQFTLGLAVTAPIIMLTNLQLRTVQATDAKQQFLFKDYLGLRLISTGLALLLIIFISFFSGYHRETSLVVFLIGVAKSFESISDVFHGLIQQHERMDRIGISLMIKGPISLLMLAIGVHLTNSVWGGVVGLIIAWACVLMIYDIRTSALILTTAPIIFQREVANKNLNWVEIKPRWHRKTLINLVWLTLPLGFVMMLVSLNTNIPRYFIELYLGERELGIFAALAYLMVAGKIVVTALAQSASPRLAKYYSVGNIIAFRRLLFQLIGIAIVLGGAGVLVSLVAGKEILTIVYKPEYAKHTTLFMWLMIAAAVDYVFAFLGYGMMAVQYFRIQIPLLALVSLTSAICSFLLIPKIGMQGAAIAQFLATVVATASSIGVIFHALHKLNSQLQQQRKQESEKYDIN